MTPPYTDSAELAGGQWAVCAAIRSNGGDGSDLKRNYILRMRPLESQILAPNPLSVATVIGNGRCLHLGDDS